MKNKARQPHTGDRYLNAAQYGFARQRLARVPAIEREKREWAINFKMLLCALRCILRGRHEPLSRGSRSSHRNGFLIIFLVISCLGKKHFRTLF